MLTTEGHMKLILFLVLTISLTAGCSSNKKKQPESKPAKKAETKTENKAKPDEKPHWGYTGLFGPEMWGNLDSAYKLCKDGEKQSPINLVWKKPTKTGPINFKYKQQNLTTIDSGRTIGIDVAPGSIAEIRGELYSLLNIVFRLPSEHTISDKQYPLEIQFIHKNTKGEMAIVSVLAGEGAKNSVIEAVLAAIPTAKNKVNKTDVKFNPSDLTPKVTTYYHYEGSITTPPCTESVNWNVFNTTLEVSAEQINRLKAVYSGNNRTLQKLNGRETTNY